MAKTDSAENHPSYGPLSALIGIWEGDQGSDTSPEPDGAETSPYREVLTFEPAGDVTNAEQQQLQVVRYHQQVFHLQSGATLHDQIGYWTWDSNQQTITQSVTIPRGVAIIATGHFSAADHESTHIAVDAALSDSNASIAQSPFMTDNAKTSGYHHTLEIQGNILNYRQTIMLEIYGKQFEHTDSNTLTRVQ